MVMLSIEEWMRQMLKEGRAMQSIHKNRIEQCERAEIDIEAGLTSLEDALKALESPEEEHCNSSAANYKDYIREEEATTGREE